MHSAIGRFWPVAEWTSAQAMTANAAEPPIRLQNQFCASNDRFRMLGSCAEWPLFELGYFRCGSTRAARSKRLNFRSQSGPAAGGGSDHFPASMAIRDWLPPLGFCESRAASDALQSLDFLGVRWVEGQVCDNDQWHIAPARYINKRLSASSEGSGRQRPVQCLPLAPRLDKPGLSLD